MDISVSGERSKSEGSKIAHDRLLDNECMRVRLRRRCVCVVDQDRLLLFMRFPVGQSS